MCAWVRMCGGTKKKKSLISQLDTLAITLPSSVTGDPSTKRTFIKNSLLQHLGNTNNYSNNFAFITNANVNTLTVNSVNSIYGASIVTNCEADEEYKISFSGGTYVYIMYYQSDGTFISATPVQNNGVFNVPSNAEYVIINCANMTTFTLNSLEYN